MFNSAQLLITEDKAEVHEIPRSLLKFFNPGRKNGYIKLHITNTHLTPSFPEKNLDKSEPQVKPFWILMKQETMGWQWHQLEHTLIICTSLQTDNHASTSSLNFLQARCSSWCRNNSFKALKAIHCTNMNSILNLYDECDKTLTRSTSKCIANAHTWNSGLQLPPAYLTWAAAITLYEDEVVEVIAAQTTELSPLSSLYSNSLAKSINFTLLSFPKSHTRTVVCDSVVRAMTNAYGKGKIWPTTTPKPLNHRHQNLHRCLCGG